MRDGDKVAVISAGPVGILAADCAWALGASKVVVAARGARMAVVRKLGFDTVDTAAPGAVDGVIEPTAGGADVAIDAAGTPETMTMALAMLARGGRCSTVGIPTEQVQLNLSALVLDELELIGARAATGEMAPVLDFMADGRLRASELISHRFALEEFPTAMDVVTKRVDGAVKVMIDMSRS